MERPLPLAGDDPVDFRMFGQKGTGILPAGHLGAAKQQDGVRPQPP